MKTEKKSASEPIEKGYICYVIQASVSRCCSVESLTTCPIGDDGSDTETSGGKPLAPHLPLYPFSVNLIIAGLKHVLKYPVLQGLTFKQSF